jgi:ABC-type lipoprotein export system ATPase subunit
LNAAGLTLILVTHDAAIGASAQRIVSMRDGQISGDEPTAPPQKASTTRKMATTRKAATTRKTATTRKAAP